MVLHKLKKYGEPIGLALLLIAFGLQCLEEHTYQMKVDGHLLELNEKLIAIWDGIYDEAVHSNRYDGKTIVWVNYDSIAETIKGWEQIQQEFSTINEQATLYFAIRSIFYVLGSVLVIWSKVPDKIHNLPKCQCSD